MKFLMRSFLYMVFLLVVSIQLVCADKVAQTAPEAQADRAHQGAQAAKNAEAPKKSIPQRAALNAAVPQKTKAQNSDSSGEQSNKAADKAGLPAEYRGIKLGMDMNSVKESLKKDAVFGYRGERDISMNLTANRSLIESEGISFIKRSWFQFYKDNLYTMILKLNTDIIDYYSVYSVFCEKYGEPASINPERAVWEDEHTRVVIERPLIVKYIDMTVFNELVSQSAETKDVVTANRQSFLDDF